MLVVVVVFSSSFCELILNESLNFRGRSVFDVLISLLLSLGLFFYRLKNKLEKPFRHRRHFQNDNKILYMISDEAALVKLRLPYHIFMKRDKKP